MPRYYEWGRTLSYNANITIVCGARSIGKTFGFRKFMVKESLETGRPFAEIARYANELESIEDGYFDKLQATGEFTDKVFRIEKHRAFAAPLPPEGDKPQGWQLVGYFCALTQAQSLKKKTFLRPKNILLDEAFLESTDRYHRYIPREYETFANLVSTLVRENEDDPATDTRIVLLGNSVDLLNPYFSELGINKVPKFGYQWFNNKSVLLHYVEEDAETIERKKSNTLVGIMLANNEEAATVFENEFSQGGDEFVEQKPKTARFQFGIVYDGHKYGVWVDTMVMYVCSKIPNNTDRNVWALTYADNRIDYNAARRSTPALKQVIEWYYRGRVRYESPALRERFISAMRTFGIR